MALRARLMLLTLGAFWTMACVTLAADQAKPAEGTAPRFKISLRNADDTAGTWTKNDVTVVSIKCPSGIGRAAIERKADRWPRLVVLYLHVKALEHLRVGNGKDTLHAVVRVGNDGPKVRQWKNAQESQPLQKTDPLWMNICPMTPDGKPAAKVPLNDGYFEITLPAAFFDNAPKSVTLRWIDFYR